MGRQIAVILLTQQFPQWKPAGLETGKPAGGHLTRAVNLLDGRFVKSGGRD
jgi:hypothetical protein